MNINQVKGGKSNNNKKQYKQKTRLRRNNTPLNKVVLLQTRREVMKRRTNSFVHIAKSQIMMSIIARQKESMS